MNTPINVTIQRPDGQWHLIEIIPICIEERKAIVNTGIYQLYESYPDSDNLEDFEEDNPYFLGELHFMALPILNGDTRAER